MDTRWVALNQIFTIPSSTSWQEMALYRSVVGFDRNRPDQSGDEGGPLWGIDSRAGPNVRQVRWPPPVDRIRTAIGSKVAGELMSRPDRHNEVIISTELKEERLWTPTGAPCWIPASDLWPDGQRETGVQQCE